MASCTRIDGLLQTYVDGELSAADRVVLEQHVSECTACAEALKSYQRSSAMIFEAFGESRLQHSLEKRVMENLPDRELAAAEVASVNWRAKHPVDPLRRLVRWLPAGVFLALLVMGGVLWRHWPATDVGDEALGVITYSQGDTALLTEDGARRYAVAARDFVRSQERYETGPDGSLMLTLAGPTQVKLNQNTRVRVVDNRDIRVERGQVWLDVGRDGRLFKVRTTSGEITVFGTAFDVSVDDGKTTVTVERGEVHLESKTAFTALVKGQQAEIAQGERPTAPKQVNVDAVTDWSHAIVAEAEATDLFERIISAQYEPVPMRAKQVFLVNTVREGRPRDVNAIQLRWQPTRTNEPVCGYTLYVTGERDEPLFRETIPAHVFSDPDGGFYEIEVPGERIRNVYVLHIEVVPDFSSGRLETEFSGIDAIGI